VDRSIGSPRTRSVVGVRGPGLGVFGLPFGLHNIDLKAKEYSSHVTDVRGKFWSMLLFMFYLEAIYLPTLKKVIRSWQMSYCARFGFTQMCV